MQAAEWKKKPVSQDVQVAASVHSLQGEMHTLHC